MTENVYYIVMSDESLEIGALCFAYRLSSILSKTTLYFVDTYARSCYTREYSIVISALHWGRFV